MRLLRTTAKDPEFDQVHELDRDPWSVLFPFPLLATGVSRTGSLPPPQGRRIAVVGSSWGGDRGDCGNDGAQAVTAFALDFIGSEEVVGAVAVEGARPAPATASALIRAVAADVLEFLMFSSRLSTKARTRSFESGSPPTGG